MKNLLLLCPLFLLGCTSVKTLQAVDGSKADATVKLAYEYGLFERPVVDWNSADNTARQRCAVWGYKKAERFDGTQNTCIAHNGYGDCVRVQINVTYQCV